MKTVVFLIFLALLIGCESPPSIHHVIVLEAYLEDVDANDGVVEKEWRTLVKLDNRSRAILKGKYGKPGDTLVMKYRTGTWYTKTK